MSTPREHFPWPTTLPASKPAPARLRTPRRRHSDPPTDFDELSAGNAGFEGMPKPATPQERAEYERGWRAGMGSGLVGGALMGALSALSLVALGVKAGLAVL